MGLNLATNQLILSWIRSSTTETEGTSDDISTYTLLTKERKKEKGSFVTEEEVCEIFSQIQEARRIKELEQNGELTSQSETLLQQQELVMQLTDSGEEEIKPLVVSQISDQKF